MMQSINRRSFAAASIVLAVASTATAAPPVITLDGFAHVVTFTSPEVYDFTTEDSSSHGEIASATFISHDLKGNLEGILIDKGDDIELTTEFTGKCKTSNGITVITEKLKGYGDLGNGDSLSSRGSKRSEIHGSGPGATIVSTLKIKTCVKLRLPFSEDKYSVHCNSNVTGHEAPFSRSGDWSVRMELNQPDIGDIFGTGSITTNIHSAKFKRTTDVIVEGSYRDGIAKLKLSSLFKGGDGPVTLIVEMVAGPGVTHPAVLAIREAKGKLLGQKFNEVVY